MVWKLPSSKIVLTFIYYNHSDSSEFELGFNPQGSFLRICVRAFFLHAGLFPPKFPLQTQVFIHPFIQLVGIGDLTVLYVIWLRHMTIYSTFYFFSCRWLFQGYAILRFGMYICSDFILIAKTLLFVLVCFIGTLEGSD